MTAYEQRYQRELHDTGVAVALAQHDPKALDKLLPPAPVRPIDGKWW